MNQTKQKIDFEPHFLQYWDHVKNVVDEEGWVYSKEVPYLLDAYFEHNTGQTIEFQKMYEYTGSWRGSRWRPKSITD